MTLKSGEHPVAHPGGARRDRRQGPHDRHEPRHHDGERAALFEERVGLVQVALLEEARVRLEHRGADVPADPVPDLATEDGGDRDEHQQLPERKLASTAVPCAAVPAASMPATNSSVSPGSTGNSTPDSTKMTTSRPTSAQVPKYPMSLIGSRKSGINITVEVMAHQDTGAG